MMHIFIYINHLTVYNFYIEFSRIFIDYLIRIVINIFISFKFAIIHFHKSITG